MGGLEEAAGGAALQVISTILDFFNTYFKARTSADGHMRSFVVQDSTRPFWESLIAEQRRAVNRPEAVTSTLPQTLAAFQDSFREYERQVKKWHHLVGSDFSNDKSSQSKCSLDTQQTPTPLKDGEAKKDRKTRRMRLAPINRAKFALYGKNAISQEQKVFENNLSTLSDQMVALSKTFGYIDVTKNPPPPGGVPALLRFIALAKKRAETNVDVNIIDGAIRDKYELSRTIIDPDIVFTKLTDLAVLKADLRLKDEADAAQGLRSYENCIVVKRSGGDLNESLQLARLFSEDPNDKFSRGFFADPPDGAMLRCCAVYLKNSECDLLFKIPEGCTVQTLRQVLLAAREATRAVSKAERVKLAIRLATSVLVVHSLHLVHKLIHPEAILIVRKQLDEPHKVGFPYLAGFQGSRPDSGFTKKKSHVDAYRKRGIYFHPRDQGESEYRAERYTMEDDIYSLGVCLFEIGMWRSLLTWSKDADDYAYDDSFVPLSDLNFWPDSTLREKAGAKLKVLVEEARKWLPMTLGTEYAEVVVSCLTVGYDSNPLKKAYNTFRDENTDDPVARKYLELVLSKLRRVHQEYDQ